MSTYRNEWDCCGAVTETDSYEPDACPFCLVDTLTEQVRAQDKWISVDEGFPLGFHQECLVWRSGDNKNFHAAVDYLIDEETFSEHYYVTHWMPLPTPPKEAE